MRITDVEAIHLRLPDLDAARCDGTQDTLLVLVHTDSGLTGIGEVDSSPPVARAAIEAEPSHSIATGLRHLLVGEDPLAIDRLWHTMWHGSRYFGGSGPAVHAISGVDIALWDLAGKAYGRSVGDLLGGVYRTRVKAYASLLMPETPTEAARSAERYAAAGYRAIKFGWGPIGRDRALDRQLIAAIRGAVGDGVDIMIDAGQAWDLKGAVQMAAVYRDHGVYWLEEPLAPDDIAGYAALSAATELRIACGEQESSWEAFERLVDHGGVDVLQPDLARCGGLTQGRRLAWLSEVRHRMIVPHAFKTGVLVAASTHFVSAIPNGELIEHTVSTSPLARDLVSVPMRFCDGYVELPTGSVGLGVELDWEVVERFRVR
ncbi:MAG: mandelate racemase/muconate lactonizing enzyme family protein [Actinocatenispora sp.]